MQPKPDSDIWSTGVHVNIEASFQAIAASNRGETIILRLSEMPPILLTAKGNAIQISRVLCEIFP
jgi:hypothetical protein